MIRRISLIKMHALVNSKPSLLRKTRSWKRLFSRLDGDSSIGEGGTGAGIIGDGAAIAASTTAAIAGAPGQDDASD